MKAETILWTILLIVGGVFLMLRATSGDGMAKAYIQSEQKQFVNVGAAEDPKWVAYDDAEILDHDIAENDFASIPDDRKIAWTEESPATQLEFVGAERADANQQKYRLSMPNTIGIWVAAFFTLAIFSFLYKDNPFYKIAESVVIGVSAAYWMVVGFWDVVIPNLVAKLLPGMVKGWAMPGLTGGFDWWYLVPLVLGIMLLMRLSPAGSWIARWPLAFIIGTTAGIRLVGFIHADFLSQIRNSIVPLVVMDGGFQIWDSIANLILVIGVLACLVYFFFSFEHKGMIGHTARLGIWFLMITFGAAFGYTVMGRIALLAIRIEFLVDDWLWLIDTTGKRAADAVAMLSTMGWT